jgi:hypothetical protein
VSLATRESAVVISSSTDAFSRFKLGSLAREMFHGSTGSLIDRGG